MLMRGPRFLPLSSLHWIAIATPESNYFPSKFFKTLLKIFAPVCHLVRPYDISWLPSYFSDSRAGLDFRAGS